MQDRTHGEPPYSIVTLHGGPGAQGSIGYVAQELGKEHGVFEPMQQANSIQGQIDELHRAILTHTQPPVVLIGWSWGAWLGWLYTAAHGEYVKRLILVSSGPFESRYTEEMDAVRFSRLTPEEQQEVTQIQKELHSAVGEEKDSLFARFGEIFGKTDSYHPVAVNAPSTEMQPEIFDTVWKEAAELRKNGYLLALAGKISVPVIAIHGDYDPHPWQGVAEPLSRTLENFTFHLLKNCGHDPWQEQDARDEFFHLLAQSTD